MAGIKLLLLSEVDNVAVALGDISAGSEVEIDGMRLRARAAIPLGHKMALKDIAPGQKITKFGVPIGSATRPIAPGEHVHVHNIKSDYLTNDLEYFE